MHFVAEPAQRVIVVEQRLLQAAKPSAQHRIDDPQGRRCVQCGRIQAGTRGISVAAPHCSAPDIASRRSTARPV